MIKVTVSSDKERVAIIRQQLKENGGYCPCRLKKTEDTKCMCKEFRDLIETRTPGMCHCGLYELTVVDE